MPHHVPHRRRSDSESAPEPAEHLDPAPDALPLPFSLASSSSTGSEQRGKYLDRGKHLGAVLQRGVGLGVEQYLHDRGVALDSSITKL